MKFLAFIVLWGVLVTGAPGQPRLPAARPATSGRFLAAMPGAAPHSGGSHEALALTGGANQIAVEMMGPYGNVLPNLADGNPFIVVTWRSRVGGAPRVQSEHGFKARPASGEHVMFVWPAA
jgi:hypothetical protein